MFILWLIAVVLVIAGIVTIIRGSLLFGIVLIVVGPARRPRRLSILSSSDRHASDDRLDLPHPGRSSRSSCTRR